MTVSLCQLPEFRLADLESVVWCLHNVAMPYLHLPDLPTFTEAQRSLRRRLYASLLVFV